VTHMNTTKKFWLVIVTAILGMAVIACSCGSLSSLLPTATSAPLPVSQPTETRLPPATKTPLPDLPTATNTPVPDLPVTTEPPVYSTSPYTEDFSNSSSGWDEESTSDYASSYNSSGFYTLGVKQPNYYLVSIAPDHFARPLKDIILNVRAQPGQMNNGDYGVICRYQDIDNFYMAAINGKQFSIGKLVNGEWTYLTDPNWQDMLVTTTDAEGYNTIGFSCINSFLVLEVNGMGAAHVTDDTFTTGDAGLIVWSYETKSAAEFYAYAGFDDFSLELP
jgi:hypothetical protein